MARCRGQRYEAVLFDLDGTLVDTGTLILKSFDRTAREVLGVEAPSEELVSAVGLSLVEQFERVARAAILGGDYERPTQALYDRSPLPELREGTVAEEVGALRDRLVRHYSEVNSELHDEYIRPFEGIAELLQALFVAGVPMGVVTSKRRCNAEADLAHYGLNRWLGLTVAADDLPWHKPDPRPILEGLQILSDAARTTGAGQALGFEPSRCVYVGDSPFDIQAGNAAGLSTIAVTWGLFPNHILAEACPSYTVDTRQELQALLLG